MTRSWLSPDSLGLLGGVIHDLLHVFGHHSQRLNEWSSASLVCRILSDLHRLECHDSWRNRNVSFLTYDGWWRIAMHYWSAFLKIEGNQNSPTVIVPISKESSSHQHQPRKSKKSFKCSRNYNGAASEHTTLAITWLPVVLNWSESELSKGCFNLPGLDGPLSGQNTMLVLHWGNG